ncbi:MAG TPA: polyprenol monophosphomannose synthase [Thermoplasmata archaeon]|nr:polyprenol monophosphomannose synthase [Thermoplasmata archaeon]
MSSGEVHALTVVVPTYNEGANLLVLFREFAKLRGTWQVPFELLVVDDDSPDGTAALAHSLGERLGIPTRVVIRRPPRSLGGAIIDGLRESGTDLVAVMDADLSHPPFLLPLMLEQLNGFDGVVASRYMSGGRIIHWPLYRRVISLGATAMAHRIVRTPCSDPLSGFFVFRPAALQGVRISGTGHKPLFEVLAHRALTICEVPYVFRNRENGTSKLGGRGILDYLRLTMRLWHDREPLGDPAGAARKHVRATHRDP